MRSRTDYITELSNTQDNGKNLISAERKKNPQTRLPYPAKVFSNNIKNFLQQTKAEKMHYQQTSTLRMLKFFRKKENTKQNQ